MPAFARVASQQRKRVLACSQEDLRDGEDVAGCPSCSLRIRIIFDEEDLDEYGDEG